MGDVQIAQASKLLLEPGWSQILAGFPTSTGPHARNPAQLRAHAADAGQEESSWPAKIHTLPQRGLAPTALGAAYFLAAFVSLKVAAEPVTALPIWAPAGIGVAAFIIAGRRAWPPILIAAFAARALTSSSWLAAVLVGGGSAVQAAAGAYLVDRFAGGRDVFRQPHDVFRFAALVAPTVAMAGATCAVLIHVIWPGASPSSAGHLWIDWSLGQLTGMLVVTPLVVLWATSPWRHLQERTAEGLTLIALFVPASLIVFADLLPVADDHYPLAILCVPFLLWAAFRLGRRASATVVALLAFISGAATLLGHGPFVRSTLSESFVFLQINTCAWAVMALSLSAVVSEHAQAARLAAAQAVTDPLTGLANLRRLVGAIDVEIARSQRTHRPFALLFVDVDGLKHINDTWGHLAGNQALCRLADALRHSCREVDTPARFGGDEFVVVLPETDQGQAEAAGRRVAARLADDATAHPPLSVATGVAVYPGDGDSSARLLAAADRALYQSKAARQGLTRAGA